MAAFVAVLLCSDLIGVQKVSYVNLPLLGEYIYGSRRAFLSDQLSVRRCPDRGLRLQTVASGDMGRGGCFDLCVGNVLRGSKPSSGENHVYRPAKCGEYDLRSDLADRARFPAGFLGGRIYKFSRPCQDERSSPKERHLWMRTIGSTLQVKPLTA